MARVTFRPLLFLLFALAWGSASAQLRPIPDTAKRGAIQHLQELVVAIDGTAIRLAPGAQVRNQQNMIITPMQIPPGALVKYLLDPTGQQVQRVWILTPEEAARPDPRR